MGKRVEYYCDCCKIPVEFEDELTTIEISLGSKEGIQYKDVCFDCWKEYTNRIAEVAKDMFE